MQHQLNNHMVGKGGWKRTDDVADIERPTKRRCLRRRRNTKSRIQKNVQGKIANQLPAAAHRVEGKLSKPVVPNKPCVRRLSIAQGKIQNLNQVGVSQVKKKVPKIVVPDNLCAQGSLEKKSKTKLQVSVPPRRSRRLREKAGCIHDGISVVNKDSSSIPKKKKKSYNVKRNKKVCMTLTFSHRAMRRQYKFWIVDIEKDNNSLFRAFAHQLYGRQDLHGVIRDKCCLYLKLYREKFELRHDRDLNIGGFQQYLDGMKNRQLKGGNLAITAVRELYNRPVQIYAEQQIQHTTISDSVSHDAGLFPLRLTVDNDNFYKSVVTVHHEKTKFVCGAGVFEDNALYIHAMKVEHGFTIHLIPEDGNCLFSAFGHQIYGDKDLHARIRDKCCAFIEIHAEEFKPFINFDFYVDFSHYLTNMRTLGQWGTNLEVEALSRIYQRKVEVYEGETTPRLLIDGDVNYNNDLPPVRISYRNGVHYDSVITEDHGDNILNKADFGKIEGAALNPQTN